MKPSILTRSGIDFDLASPLASSVRLEDVANGLSNTCRFTGQVETFYSVAEHSLYVSYAVPQEYALQGLMHDAAEAYIGDVTAPLKQLLPQYKTIERRVEAAVFSHFGLPRRLHPSVKSADLSVLATEVRDLVPQSCYHWSSIEGIAPLELRIERPMAPAAAKAAFLLRYATLMRAQRYSLNIGSR